MRHYRALVTFHFVEPQSLDSADAKNLLAAGFFVTLGVLSLRVGEATSYSLDRLEELAPAPGRVIAIEITEMELEALSSHVREAAEAATGEGVYYSTGLVYFPPERAKPWWKLWSRA
jgi:hypothetical protein